MADVSDYVDLVGPDGQTVRAARSELSPDFIQQYAADAAQQPPMQAPPPPLEPSILGNAARGAAWGMIPGGGVINAIDQMQGARPEVAQEAARSNPTDLGGMLANAVAPNMAAQARLGNAEADKRLAHGRAKDEANARAVADAVAKLQAQPAQAPGAPGVQAPVEQAFKPYGGGNNGAMNAAFKAQEDSARRQAELGAQKAAEDFGYQREALQQQNQLEADRQRMVGEYQRHRQEGMDRLQKMNDDFAQQRVDPQRFWSNRSGFDRAMAAIGVALGGFGGGQNDALKIINQAVDNDIEAQKANIAHKDKALDNQRGIMGLVRQNFGDDIEANAAAKAALTTQLQSRIQMMASKYESPELKAKADGLVGQLEEQKQKAIAEFDQRRSENGFKMATLGIEQQKLEIERARYANEAAKKTGPKQLDAAQVKDLAEKQGAIGELKNLMGQYRQKAAGLGSSIKAQFGGTDAASFYRQVSPIATKIAKALHGGGRLTPDVMKRVDDLMPKPSDMASTSMRKMQDLLDMAEQDSRTSREVLSSSGYAVPAAPQQVPLKPLGQ